MSDRTGPDPGGDDAGRHLNPMDPDGRLAAARSVWPPPTCRCPPGAAQSRSARVHDAACDAERIDRHWYAYPHDNIAIRPTLGVAARLTRMSVRDVGATLADALGGQLPVWERSWAAAASMPIDVKHGDTGFVVAPRSIRSDTGAGMIGCIPPTGEPAMAYLWLRDLIRKPSRRPGPGVAESTARLGRFPNRLTDRALAYPLLVVSDGAAGLSAAIDRSSRPRCANLPDPSCYATCSPRSRPGGRPRSATATGPASTPPTSRPSPARGWSSSSTPGWARSLPLRSHLPAAMKTALTDREGLTVLRFPRVHLHRVWHSISSDHLRATAPRRGYRPLPGVTGPLSGAPAVPGSSGPGPAVRRVRTPRAW